MAAGDIIIPNNTITPEIMQKIAAEIIKQINTNTKDPGQWEVVESTNGVTSLPVLQVMGATYKLVRVAISTLQGVNGREVELQMNAERTAIQWRYVAVAGSDLQPTEWITLIDVSLLKGDPGETPEFRQGISPGLEWKYKSESADAWRVLVSIDVLKLKFSDLTEDNIAEFWRGVPADVMAEFQKPATEVASEVREQMIQISQEASAAIKAATDAASNAQDAADNVQDGKTTQFEIGTVESGAAPSASLTDNGVDATGNPKKKLNLVMQKGDNAKSPTVQTGTITTGDPASEVTFTFTETGMTEDGRPIWRVDGVIPRGQQGLPDTGSGNVSAVGTGLAIGKKYLFVPDSDGSTAGTFVEYVAPEIPEQVQPDWTATEGKGSILHKPGDATSDKSGLMSADQFQKLEKVSPDEYIKKDGTVLMTAPFSINTSSPFIAFSIEGLGKGAVGYDNNATYLYNAARTKKVEYTDAGILLFEGKEAFAVDADNELTLAGKKLSELGGGNQYLDLSLLFVDGMPVNSVTQECINALQKAYDNNVSTGLMENGFMPISVSKMEDITSYGVLVVAQAVPENMRYSVMPMMLTINYSDFSVISTISLHDFIRNGNGTKALMDDGTYKEVGGDYQLPSATDSALGGIKTGYTTSGKNYPVQLDGSDKAYVNVPWTDTDTTYSPATQSANGLMSSTDKTKLDHVGSYKTATTVAGLDAYYENIEISDLTANASLSLNLIGENYNGWHINVFIYCSSARTITIPTSGNYISMIGSSLACPAGKWTELNLYCAGGKWRIAKMEQE